MIDNLNYPDDYIEELESEIHTLREGHNDLVKELQGVYGSRTYKIGTLARIAYKNPVRIAKKAASIAKNTRRISPRALKHFRSATPHTSAAFNNAYKRWQKAFEPDAKELETQRQRSKDLKKQPKFSIITPVFQPPKDVLIALLESVLAQTYPNFELCLGEFSGDLVAREVLTEYAKKDSRLKVKFFDDNAGISANSNHCAELATGDYICLLDHDDLLSPDALYENAKLINEKDYDFIYSDKDKVDEAGNRFDPMFKPDWSPDIMLTANYPTHFNVFKKSLLDKVGKWDKDTDGAQDWDLFFRLIGQSMNIGHIPKILYHWRVIATSTAHSISTKPYALGGQRKAIGKYIESLGIDPPVISHSKNGALKLEWGPVPLASVKPHCIIIAGQDSMGRVRGLAKKLKKNKHLNDENITVYNADDSGQSLGQVVETLQAQADILVFVSANISSLGRAIWLEELAGWLSVPGVGIACPQTYSKYGVFIDGGRVVGLGSAATPIFAGETYTPGIFGYREWSRNVTMPAMSCFAINSKVLAKNKITQSGLQGLREIVLKSIENGYRTVVTPFDQAVIDTVAIYEPPMSEPNKKIIKGMMPDLIDPLFSTNLSVRSMHLAFTNEDEAAERTAIIEKYLDQPVEYDPAASAKRDLLYAEKQTLPLVGYKRDAYILAGITDYTPEDITNSRKITDSGKNIDHVESALWIVPDFTTLYAGLKNIFALASELTNSDNTRHTFYITTAEGTKTVEELVLSAFPNLAGSEFLNAKTYNKAKDSANYTIGVCTLWTTAYELLKNNNMQRKLYIIQDDERSFYPRGTIYGLVNASYDFGFWGIAGTPALADWYSRRQGSGKSLVLGSDIQLSTYLKSSGKTKTANKTSSKVPRVLFYARPDAPRNAFELGLHGLNQLAEKMQGNVDIVLAGANFDLAQYENVHPSIHLAGKVAYAQLPEFYAGFDAALFLMLSEHPGVFPLEMMASNVPVVINKHHNASWNELYIGDKTCVLADTSASSIAGSLQRVLTDKKLRTTVIREGRKLAEKQDNTSYETQAKDLIKGIKSGEYHAPTKNFGKN